MAFVNEYIAEEDKEKYGLDELWASYHDVLNKKLPNKKSWTIDRGREIWLMETGKIPDIELDHAYLPEQIWTLYSHGIRVEVRIEPSKNKDIDGVSYQRVWDLNSLSPSSLDNLTTKSLINILDEALKTYGYMGVALQKANFSIALRDCRKDK